MRTRDVDERWAEYPSAALITTTQAATVINGGQKVNALPEYVTAVM